MASCCSAWLQRCGVAGILLIAYVTVFPEDLEALLSPVRHVLALTEAISPAAYGLAAVAVACIAWRSPPRSRA